MIHPFFSVLIPTKNRSHVLGYAIQSVLNQTYGDFEIIIADNDDTDATKDVVEKFPDTRIRYFRTGDLNMCQNWEYALLQSRGDFVTLLEDKQAYYKFALEKISSVLERDNVHVVTWEWDVYDDRLEMAYSRMKPSKRIVDKFSSDDALLAYVSSCPGDWRLLPRMLNSCVSRKIISKIKSNPKVDNFFEEVSPDLCASFYTLAVVEELCFINVPLGVVGYLDKLSNANMFRKRDVKLMTYFGGDFTKKMVDLVPVKDWSLTHNTVYNDFLRIRNAIGGRLLHYHMSPENYVIICLLDLTQVRFCKKTFKEIMNYARQNNLALLPLFSFFAFNKIVRAVVQNIYRVAFFKKILVKFRYVSWKSQNVMDAAMAIEKNDFSL